MTIALAIGLPMNLPTWASSPSSRAGVAATAPAETSVPAPPSMHRLDPRASCDAGRGLAFADQSEENDEGDDVRDPAPILGPVSPGELPSLIPAPLGVPESASPPRRFAPATPGRLRC